MEKFHIRLKECREKKKDLDSKWTQGFIAEKIGVARVTYTAYENGTKQPPLDTINKIADILGVSADYLLGRTENPYMLEDEEFERFKNNPELERWYKELPKNDEEDLQALKDMWEIIKRNKKK